MSKRIVTDRNNKSSVDLIVYDGESLTTVDSWAPTEGVESFDLTKNGGLFLEPDAAEPLHWVRLTDGGFVHLDSAAIPGNPQTSRGGVAFNPADDSQFAAAVYDGIVIGKIENDEIVITDYAEQGNFSGFPGNNHCAWHPDGSVLFVIRRHNTTTGSDGFGAVTVSDGVVGSEIGYITDSGSYANLNVSPDGRWILVHSALSSFGLRLFEYTGTGLVNHGIVMNARWGVWVRDSVDRVFTARDDSNDTNYILRIWEFDPSDRSFTQLYEQEETRTTRAAVEKLGIWHGDQIAVGRVWTVANDTLSVDSADISQNSWAGVLFQPPDESPPTEEEVFRATFADASGQPAYTTALVSAADCQRLINHNVSLWAGKPGVWRGQPKWYRIPVESIEYGELHKAVAGKPIFIRADQPGLREGKRLLIMDTNNERSSVGPAELLCMGWEHDDD